MAPWVYRALVLSLMTGLAASEYCSVTSYTYPYFDTYKYCDYGCCSNDCCSYSGYSAYTSVVSSAYTYGTLVAIIVGSVIGGIVFIASIVAIICCCIKSQSRPGRVIHTTPATSGTATVVSSGVHMNQAWSAQPGASAPYGPQFGPQFGPQYGPQYGPQPGAQFSGPPPYQPSSDNKGGPPPPPSLYTDPAYPPTGTSHPTV